jgi:hypothetical protein
VSPTERRTAESGDVGVSTGPGPFVTSPDGPSRAPAEPDVAHHGPVEIPEIVPATIDEPEPATPQPPSAPDPGDPPDAWTGAGGSPVVLNPNLRTGQIGLRPPTRRPRVRKVTRVLRHIDPWSTFKLALVFSVILYGILLTAGVLIWNVALNTGTVDNVERWFTQFGWDTFEMKGGEIYHNAWVGGLFGVVALTGFAVLAVTLFNLVSDMIGGIRMTVLEEEVVERTVTPGRKFVVRRPPVDDETAGTFDLDGDLPAPAAVDSSAPTTSATSAPATTTASTSTAPTPADEPSRAVEESPT